ncbi:MAG: hypothetical protein CVV41_10865 [Candidatus Riflebacteria bacterium HGW-Riflebacteria-1]|jgi:chaperonin cofactor prefoldin|nr:MAG: hypothetical protein CVV41_10865 [Candidatus Riflebacteria bacterium HGW-Riflebacteria-1]
MRKLFILLILTLCCNQLSAQLYQTFNLDEFIARHPTTRSYDPISRSFNGSENLRQQLASLTVDIAQLNEKLEAMKLIQSKDAKAFLDATGAPDEDSFWQNNRVQSNEAGELKSRMFNLIDQKKQIELLLPRDTVILPEINELAADIRDSLTDKDAIYLNYLPVATPTNLSEKWLSSPLQIFLWTPHEKYLEEYLDSSYAVSLMFPESRRPVVYQKSVKGENKR